ncbi:conserved hypothetical protein [Vibrio phage 150E35-1]|nr:conserved hypothetical protein [Vibrio phage 150E35-1]
MATGITVLYDKPKLEHTGKYPQVGARVNYDRLKERNEIRTELRMDYYEILLKQLKDLASEVSSVVSDDDPEFNGEVTLVGLGPFIHEQIGIHNGTSTGKKDPLYTVAITSVIITYLDNDLTLALADVANGYDATGDILGRHSSTYPSESSDCYVTETHIGIDLLPGISN